ncbi:MAG: tetratricopeptide repeat protein [Pseudomonadota bacterium]
MNRFIGESLRRTASSTWLHVAILIAAVWLAYANSLTVPFEFDDWHVVTENPEIRSLSDIPEFFFDVSKFSILPGNRDYRPLFLTSMAVSWWLGDGSVVPFHIVSVLLHTINVLLVYAIARHLFVAHSAAKGKLPIGAALVAALIFGLHPLATEAIVYISSQSVPLAAAFYLTAFYAFLAAGRDTNRHLWAVAAWLAYFLALLSKPIAITFPLLLMLYYWLLAPRPLRMRAVLAQWLPFVVVTALYLGLRSVVHSRTLEAVGTERSLMDVALHWATQTEAMVFYYLKLAFVPIGQNVDVVFERVTDLSDPMAIGAALTLVAIAFGLFVARRHRVVVFWVLWFPVCLLVTTYLIPLGQTVREARMYLSLVGVGGAIGYAVMFVFERSTVKDKRTPVRLLPALAAGAIVLGLGLATHLRNDVWSSSLSLWRDAAQGRGTWRAHMNYARAVESTDRRTALREFERAVQLSSNAWSHLNLGLAYVRGGEHSRGIEHLRKAVRLWPSSPDTQYYLGAGLEAAGDVAAAEASYKLATQLRENYVRAWSGLAQLYDRQRKYALALVAYEKLLSLEATPARARRVTLLRARDLSAFAKGYAYQSLGFHPASIPHYVQWLEDHPRHRQVTFNLAFAYLQGTTVSDWRRSETLFAEALAIDPSYSEAVFRRAEAFWKLGEVEKAREWYRRYVEDGQSNSTLKASAKARLGTHRE